MNYIIAPSYHMAQEYARKHEIDLRKWHYVSRLKDLIGMSNKTEVLYIVGDSRGSFHYEDDLMDMIREAKVMEKRGYIEIKFIHMEDPPSKA